MACELIEHNIIVDKYGNVWHTEGDENYVNPSDKIDLDGAIDIHNHIITQSFSDQDIKFMKEHLNTTFVLVDKDNLYKVKFIKELDIPINTIYREGLDRAYQINDQSQTEHYMMEYLQNKGYVEYEKIKRNSRV